MMTSHGEEELLNKIKSLTEMEFTYILRQMAEHIARNKWEKVIDEAFEIESYEDELKEAEETSDIWMRRAKEAEHLLEQIKAMI